MVVLLPLLYCRQIGVTLNRAWQEAMLFEVQMTNQKLMQTIYMRNKYFYSVNLAP